MTNFGRKESANAKVDEQTTTFSEPVAVKTDPSTALIIPIYETKVLKLNPQLIEFKDNAFERLILQIDLAAASRMPIETLRREIERFIADLAEENQAQINFREQQQISEEILNDMIGLGPLEPLLKDPTVTDIMVNGPHNIYVECRGKLEKADIEFRNKKHVLHVAQRIANQIGRRVDESSPMVDARLKDGSRVNVIIPPLALDGATISIRRFSNKIITLERMAEQGNMSPTMYKFLEIAAKCRLNIIVSGGTGSGKTTLLNALSQLINVRERIITIEDSAELQLQQPHVVRLETRPANIEGEGEVTIRDLVRNSLRMRPDRIIIGECRGPEALDMLQAMNTGHDGSMSTVHANNGIEALNRLENLVLMSGYDLPTTVIKHYITDAVDLIVQTARMRDGIRRVKQIMEVVECRDGQIISQDIFNFSYSGDDDSGRIKGNFNIKTSTPHISRKVADYGLLKDLEDVLGAHKNNTELSAP